jgi:hypothetical protein
MEAPPIARDFRALEIVERPRLVDSVVDTLAREGSAAAVGADAQKLRTFVDEVSRRYRPNPYHNFNHAADVLHTVSWMLTRPALRRVFSPNQAFWLQVAAITHDVDHPGNTNQWELAIGSPLAKKYGSVSILERHSLDLTRDLLTGPACAFHGTMKGADAEEGGRLLEEAILATDFARHKEFLADLGTAVAATPVQRRIVAEALIKGADIANVTHAFDDAKQWAERVMEEFRAEGRMAMERSLPVAPLNDPARTSLVQAQIGFIRFAGLGLYELLARIDPGLGELVETLKGNLKRYEAEAATGTTK